MKRNGFSCIFPKIKLSWPDVYFKGSPYQNNKGVTIYIFLLRHFRTWRVSFEFNIFGSKTISGLRNTNKHLFWYIRVRSWIFCVIFNENIKGNVIVESGRHWKFVVRHLIFNTQTKCHFNERKNHKFLFTKSENWYSITSLKYPYLIFYSDFCRLTDWLFISSLWRQCRKIEFLKWTFMVSWVCVFWPESD